MVALIVAFTLLGPIAVFELRTSEIPNVAPLACLAGAVLVSIYDRSPALHFAGLATSALPALWLWRKGFMGGGAAKLLIGLGAILGPLLSLVAWLSVGIAFAKIRIRGGQSPSSPYAAFGVLVAMVLVQLTRPDW